MTPEMYIILQMLMARVLHLEHTLDFIISSGSLPSDLSQNSLLVTYKKLPIARKDRLRYTAEQILAMYDILPVKEDTEIEPEKPIAFFNAPTIKFEPKTDEFAQDLEDLSKKEAVV